MAKYEKYADYQDSGVEWVGDIPSSWEVKPVFALFTSEMEKNLYGSETNVLSLSYGRIIQRDVENNHGLLPESFNTYQIVNDGDIILRLTDLQNDKRSLRVGLVTQKGIITSAYLKLSALKEIDSKFAYTLLHSYDTTKVFYGMGGGLRQSMKFEDFRRLPILVPPKSEQAQIANFLDHETVKIDSLIAKQEKLIELLKEKRQAVISHAVTKGLNPDVNMKDSGVEWLGQVPEHWTIKKIKYLGSIINGYAFPSDGFTEEGIRILKISNIQNMYLDWSDLSFVSEIVAKNLEQFSVKNGDLVFALTRPIISSGIKATIVESSEKILLNQRNAILRPNGLCLKKWLYFIILNGSFVQEFNNQIDKTGQQPNISTISIGNLAIPVTSINEQKEIIEFIEEKLKAIDQLISKAESAIQLMQERRTALISSAVTGKIDVRNWQNPNHNNNEANTELGT